MPGPLNGVKVFETTVLGIGPWATMIMAAMGANVIKVEPPTGGDGARRGDAAMYRGLTTVYMHCHLGKKAIYLDLKTPEGQAGAHRLLREADVFVENMKWGTVARLGLSYEEVFKINPRIVYGNYPGWGDTGPYKDRGSGDRVTQAFSGPASITGKRGGEVESVRWFALQDFTASSYVVTTTLLGLLHRERTGKGIKILSPQQGSTIAVQTSRIAEFLATGKNVPRMGSACTTTVPHRAFLCLDKMWLAVGVITDSQWQGLCKAIKSADLLKDPRFATNPGRVKHREELEDRLQAIFTTKPARWWVIQLQKHKVPVSLFYDYETIPNLPQVKANRYIVSVKYPGIGALPFGNIPFQYSRTPVALGPGPWPGQDTERVLKEGFGQDGAGPAKGYFGPKGSMEKGVLDGITIVDITQGLCGPYASLLLADAGARVIKVEPPEGDYARHFGPPLIDGVSAVFFHLNRNKEGVHLDIGKNQDREHLLQLVKDADVLIEDEGQPRLRRLGLGYQDLEKVNPSLIYCTISPFGTKGPLRHQPASELVLQAMSDFLNNLGTAGKEPVRMGPDLASLGTSLFVTNGVLGALYHEWRTGEGQHLTVNMLGTLLHQRGITWTSIVDPDEWAGFYCEADLKPPDNGYKTADQPIAMGPIRKEEEFPELLKLLNLEGYLEDPRFQHPPRDIMGWGGKGDLCAQAKPIWEEAFKKWKAEELVELLQRFGSSCSIINNYQQLFAHPQTEALEIVKELNHPTRGKIKVIGTPWKLYGVEAVNPPRAYSGI